MPKITLEEKRLEQLRRQLYGKERDTVTVKRPSSSSDNKTSKSDGTYSLPSTTTTINPTQSNISDISYLKKDMLKIITFSSIALAIQLLLFLSLQMKLIHLGF